VLGAGKTCERSSGEWIKRRFGMLALGLLFGAIAFLTGCDMLVSDRPWRLRIDRPTPTLYLVVLRDSVGRELLRTSLFRPQQHGNETP
jgi:hypothetical protein